MKFLTENGMYAAVADNGKAIKFGEQYCHKLYRKDNDFADCTEVDISEVPVMDEEDDLPDTVYDSLNKNEDVKALFDRYNVEYEEIAIEEETT